MEEKEILYSNGILLNLYKHIDVAKFTNTLNDGYANLNTKVALGNFDRLRFYPIDDFTDFRKQSCTGHLWTGGRRDVMLFSLAESSAEKSFRFSVDKCKLKVDKNMPYGHILPWEIEMLYKGSPSPKNFISVSMLYLSGRVKNLGLSYKKLIAICKNRIAQIVDKANAVRKGREIIFEVFGSLNSAELAILWGSNEYVDIQYIVDQLRYLHLNYGGRHDRVFYSSYTIAAIYKREALPETIRGGSMIQFAASTKTVTAPPSEVKSRSFRHAAAVEYINGKTRTLEEEHSLTQGAVYSCAGEYDYIYNGKLPILNSLLRLNGNTQAFDDCNEDFQKHFSSTTTRLYYQDADVEDIANALKADIADLLVIQLNPPDSITANDLSEALKKWDELPTVFHGRELDSVRLKFTQYTTDLKKLLLHPFLDSTPYSGLSASNFLYNLDLLFCDYVQCVSTMPDLQWAKDFEYQFLSSIEVLNEKLPTEEELIRDQSSPISASGLSDTSIFDSYFSNAHNILSVLRYNIHHMSEAGKLFFEEPSSHSESTGQYDLIIHTYYGIIKTVLYEITKNSRYLHEKPTPLVPILRFSETPIIKSTLYFDGIDLTKKIVDIRIPYDACGEVGLYSPLLIHEIYHYVPPVDRVERNRTLAIILLTELFVDSLQKILVDLNIQNGDLIRDLCLKFRDLLITALDASGHSFIFYSDCSKMNNWNVFYGNLLMWTNQFDLNGKNDLGFLSFFSEILSDVYRKLKEWGMNGAVDSEMNSVIEILSKVIAPSEKLIHKLFNTSRLTPKMQEFASDCLLYRVSKCDSSFYSDIEQALRELLPDYAMIQYSNITDLSDYLLLIAVNVDKQYSKTAAAFNQSFLFFRICFIADCLLRKSGKSMEHIELELDQCEERFCTKYRTYRSLGLDQQVFGEGYAYETEAHRWISYFRNCLLNQKEIYERYRPLLQKLADQQFAPGMKEVREPVWDALMQPLMALTPEKEKLFEAELDLIRAFQPQRFLSEFEALYQEPETSSPASSLLSFPPFTPPPRFNLEYRVENALESVFAIRAAASMLEEYHRRAFGEQSRVKLWFRGCKSSTYPILPSIMVHFLDRDKSCPNGKNYIGTLVEYQRSLLEEFKYRADGASEFINASSYTTADYIALMQHYSQQTCYVDWSDDVYSSLYFALEDEIMESLEIIKQKGPNTSAASVNNEKANNDSDPVLYLFDPKLYNLARLRLLNKYANSIKEGFLKDSKKDEPVSNNLNTPGALPIYETVIKDLEEAKRISNDIDDAILTDVNVPNISMHYTAKRYGIHSYNLIYNDGPNVNNPSLRSDNVDSADKLKTATFAKFSHDLWNLPLAIYTSRLNPRIRTQSGNFLAYSVFSRPVCFETSKGRSQCEDRTKNKPKTDYFNYLSLMEIQNYYRTEFKDALPFLTTVVIPKGEKKRLADYLAHVGINKYRIYPELDNLSLS